MYILDKDKATPLYIQLYDAIKQEIINNHLLNGKKLPSVRKIATDYKISKNTVELAYKQLLIEGFIESVPKSGYFISDTLLEQYSADVIYQTQTQIEPSIHYDFFPARLTHNSFPLKLWKRLFIKAMEETLDFGAYGEKQGELGLRNEIAKYLIKSRGVVCDASQIIVCGGFADSMNIVASIFKNKFEHIAVEHPGYPVVGKIFHDYGYTLLPINVNQNGLNLDELDDSEAKLVYITPSHQYPTGVSMPIGSRIRLLNWSKRVEGIIIEDDYDSELRYQSRPLPSLQGLDNDNRVVYVGTFSKSLSPALCVSYLVLPPRYLEIYRGLFQMRHPRVSLSTQKTLELFMAGGHWERHLRKIRTLNRKKHDLMKETLKKSLGNMIEIISEGGGLCIIIRPKINIDLKKLRESAMQQGLKLYLGSDYYGDSWEALKMGFGGLDEDQIVKGIALLKTIWSESLANEKNF